jgi:UDP-N-acetylglucosamine/UDP-N-acetylgalactosamine diphosphorylase
MEVCMINAWIFSLALLLVAQGNATILPRSTPETAPLFCKSDQAIRSYLAQLQQEHLLEGFEHLSTDQKNRFILQMQQYDSTLLKRQQALLLPTTKALTALEPVQNVAHAGSDIDRAQGESLIREGKVACLILAGGQGSRLGIDAPKGTFAVSLIQGKSLFQLFSERTLAASARAERPLHLAVMTSPLNHAATEEFFKTHQHFGLPLSHLHLFEQSVLPFCDHRGNWLLERPGQLAEGPDGNGNVLHLLYRSGLYEQWRADGVEYVNVILVDNPLADPFDAELIGYHFRMQADLVLKAVPRASASEKMGVIVTDGDQIKVVEYSEISNADLLSLNPDGTPRFLVANTSLFSFHMDFIRQVGTDPDCILPLHLARKKACIGGEVVDICKYETFIFDLLPFAKRIEVLLYPRACSFAPLKNANGDNSLQTVQEALLAFDRHIYSTLSGLSPPETPFELHPSFYYPTPDLLNRWKGKELPSCAYTQMN